MDSDLQEIYRNYAQAYNTITPYTSCHREIVQQVVSALQGKQKILDAGVGTGIITRELADPNRIIYGVDLSDAMLSFAHRNLSDLIAQGLVHLSCQDIQELTFPDNFFDGIVCINTLYHIKDYQKALCELKRVAKKDSILVLSGPNRDFNLEKALNHIIEDFKKQGIYKEKQNNIETVIEYNKQLASSFMKHFFNANEVVSLLKETCFSDVLLHHNHAYYGCNYLVVAKS